MSEVKVVRTWDELPPVVFDQGQHYSTRVLEKQHREMEAEIASLRAQLAEARRALDVWVSRASQYVQDEQVNGGTHAELRTRAEKAEAERDTAWAELREIRETIGANPEESTADEVRRVAYQLSAALRTGE